MSLKTEALFILFCFLSYSSIEAKEIRAIIHDSLSACLALTQEQATYQGDYAFKDYIYSDCNSDKNLNDEFFRIREYQVTKWKQKSVVVVHKIRDPKGEQHQILFEKECDTIEQAQQYIPPHFFLRCSFFRRGWEYYHKDMRIFVEEIDDLPASIEIIAPSQEEIFNLFEIIKIVTILTDSVPEWYCKSKDNLSNQTKDEYARQYPIR